MQIKPQQLAGALQKNLAPVYFLSGDEPQQLGELADAIRQSAKQQGYTSREIFFADKAFDWKQLNSSADNYSIFADKKFSICAYRLVAQVQMVQKYWRPIANTCQKTPYC